MPLSKPAPKPPATSALTKAIWPVLGLLCVIGAVAIALPSAPAASDWMVFLVTQEDDVGLDYLPNTTDYDIVDSSHTTTLKACHEVAERKIKKLNQFEKRFEFQRKGYYCAYKCTERAHDKTSPAVATAKIPLSEYNCQTIAATKVY